MIPYGDRWDRRWAAPSNGTGDVERPPELPVDRRPAWIRLLTPSRWDVSGWRVAGVLGVLFLIAAFVATDVGLETLKRKRDRVPKALAFIAVAQEQFKQECVADEDGDKDGEYAWGGELSGTQSGRRYLMMHSSPWIAAIYGVKDARGRSAKWGRWFRFYLPDGAGGMCGEPSLLGRSTYPSGQAAVDAQELRWACVAWQKDRDAWDPRAFYVDQHGVVWKSGCEVHDYRGSPDGPTPEDVQPTQGTLADYAKTLQPFTAKDGNVWRPVSREAWAVE